MCLQWPRHSREHLALIQEVCSLKQVLSISEVKQLIDARYRNSNAEKADVFNDFNSLISSKNKEAVNNTLEALCSIEENDTLALSKLALDLASTANAYITIAKRILFLNKLYQENKKEQE